MIGLHPHLRDGLLDYLQCSNSARAIQAAVDTKSAQQIEDEAAQLRLPAGIVRTPQEWLAHPQGATVAKRPLFDMDQRGNARQRALGKARYRPLDGVRVVELAHLVAGPTVGRLLAEQGADVIKIQPPLGDWILPLWLDVNWGKRSMLTDIKSRSGKKRLIALLAGADVLVNSNAPGSLERLGLDDQTLRSINPNLIYTGVSYCPAATPWADRKGFEQIGQAVSGLMHVHSEGMPEPTVISVLINDYMTGYLGAIGAVAALAAREEKGGYWNVGASLARCATMATSLVERPDTEQYAPVTMADLVHHAVDQVTPLGVFTRLRSAVEFSHTPSISLHPTAFPGAHPDTVGWLEPSASDGPPVAPHYASTMAREGRIRNLVSCYGIEDRGDGGGGFSLASRELFKYVMAAREEEAP
jgi:hypothetical protein